MNDHLKLAPLATALRENSEEISRRWLDRVAARVAVDPQFVFPSEDLLDGIPFLVETLGAHVVDPDADPSADLELMLKARELGRLRHEQGFSARQILWEYELLGSIILTFMEEEGIVTHERGLRGLLQVLAAIQRATMEEFVLKTEEQVKEREERLRGFNRALTHELRNNVGAILGAARMLREGFVAEDPELRDRFTGMVLENGEFIEVLLENLLELARIDLDTRRNKNVLLRHAAEEVARRLRRMADAKGVEIRIAKELPQLEVNAAALDFCLTNLIVNGIKYRNAERSDAWVRVQASASMRATGEFAVIEVVDNGRGVPELERPRLFERFFRSSNSESEEGTGLGLSLVREFIERLGGRIWAEFPAGETVFVFTLPARRTEDEA